MDSPALANQQDPIVLTCMQTVSAISSISQEQWKIGMDGKREYNKYVFRANLDNDDDDACFTNDK